MPGSFRIPSQMLEAPWQISDPGNGAAIQVTQSGQISVVTAGSETNTLPNPFKEGIDLVLEHMTDGGSRAITAATAINEAGNTVITLTDVREAIGLKSVKTASGYRWQVTWNQGATLS